MTTNDILTNFENISAGIIRLKREELVVLVTLRIQLQTRK
jgi:hypothetical protein